MASNHKMSFSFYFTWMPVRHPSSSSLILKMASRCKISSSCCSNRWPVSLLLPSYHKQIVVLNQPPIAFRIHGGQLDSYLALIVLINSIMKTASNHKMGSICPRRWRPVRLSSSHQKESSLKGPPAAAWPIDGLILVGPNVKAV